MPREKMAGGNLREDVAEVALEQWTERSKERRQRFRNLVRRMKTVWNGCRIQRISYVTGRQSRKIPVLTECEEIFL